MLGRIPIAVSVLITMQCNIGVELLHRTIGQTGRDLQVSQSFGKCDLWLDISSQLFSKRETTTLPQFVRTTREKPSSKMHPGQLSNDEDVNELLAPMNAARTDQSRPSTSTPAPKQRSGKSIKMPNPPAPSPQFPRLTFLKSTPRTSRLADQSPKKFTPLAPTAASFTSLDMASRTMNRAPSSTL